MQFSFIEDLEDSLCWHQLAVKVHLGSLKVAGVTLHGMGNRVMQPWNLVIHPDMDVLPDCGPAVDDYVIFFLTTQKHDIFICEILDIFML